MAKKDKYKWIIGEQAPPIDAHSVAKQRVLQGYLKRYLKVLTANPRRDKLNIYLVDGFSGGGLYQRDGELVLGSPFVLLDTVRESEVTINLTRRKPLLINARFYFIDKNKSALAYLKHELVERDYGSLIDERLHIISGRFEQKILDVIKDIKGRSPNSRVIFLLDQYGYKDVPLGLIKNILGQLPNAEIILNFATDSLVNFLSDTEMSRKAVEKSHLSKYIDWKGISYLKSHNADWRLVIEKELAEGLRIEAGAPYATRFFIRSEESNRAYWLVHLCRHPTAYNEMVKLHWEMHNTFTRYGPAGFTTIGYDPRADEELSESLFFDFQFDDESRNRSYMALREQLPDKLPDSGNGISFGRLKDMCFNSTPVHSEIIQDAAIAMMSESSIEIVGVNGEERRSARAIRDDDVVRRLKQSCFVFKKPS